MKWQSFIVSRENRSYTSECGRFKILAPWYRGGSYSVYVDGQYAASFQHLSFAKKNAERIKDTGRLIGGALPDFEMKKIYDRK